MKPATFKIIKEDNLYIAEGIELGIVTDGDTLKKLEENIIDATALHQDVTIEEIMQLNQNGGSFDYLNDEPYLYTINDIVK